MPVQVVTGFIPIAGHPRKAEEYAELGKSLCAELTAMKMLEYPVMDFHRPLSSCWMHDWILSKGKEFFLTHSTADNPVKNTLAYHIVQHEKVALLKEAAYHNFDADVFVWIDFGILHVPGVTATVIGEFLQRARGEKTICIPGCWPRGPVDDAHPCWRFCGGAMIVPRPYLYDLDIMFRAETIKHVSRTRNLSWEVNTLARMEQAYELPIWWYQADHNETMFTNYKGAAANA